MMDRKQYSSVISIMRMREIEEPPSAQDEMVEVEDGADLEDLDSQLGRSKDEQMQKILEISQKQTWILEHLMASGAISVDRVKAFVTDGDWSQFHQHKWLRKFEAFKIWNKQEPQRHTDRGRAAAAEEYGMDAQLVGEGELATV